MDCSVVRRDTGGRAHCLLWLRKYAWPQWRIFLLSLSLTVILVLGHPREWYKLFCTHLMFSFCSEHHHSSLASHHFSTVVSSVLHRQCSELVRSCSVCSAPTPASKESRRRVRSRSKSPFRSFRWKKTKTSPSEAPGSASDDESNLERAAGNFFYFVKVEGAPRHCV